MSPASLAESSTWIRPSDLITNLYKSKEGSYKRARAMERRGWSIRNSYCLKLTGNRGSSLKVSFFWPFSGDYWIIDLGKDYEYAVVGHPNRTYLWILSRTKKIDETIYQEILDRIKARALTLQN